LITIGIEVVVEGPDDRSIHHALSAIANGKHIVMVNVEPTVAGPLLARRAKAAGVIYSLPGATSRR
jgi:predicted homoserine dehydrogenase-like protein